MALALLMPMTNVYVMDLVIKVGDKVIKEDHWAVMYNPGSRWSTSGPLCAD